jgi:histidinol dehydrogenase
VARLSRRLDATRRLDTAAYRARVKALFGRPLSPEQVVARIVADVRARGDRALVDYARRLDGVRLSARRLRVTRAELRAGYRRTPTDVRRALELAAARIAEYQRWLMPRDLPPRAARTGPPGVKCGLSWSPLKRVGIYVPGGTAAYPSSVLMNAAPAQVAGVREIALATPCARDGAVSDGVLCACEVLGLKEVYRLGGAQAIAALAYGTRSVRPVEKIVGPGNLFVMLAKRAVFGQVDIDMLAGPSEVLILADQSARPDWIAADLLAQAEHDPLAACMLVTDAPAVAAAVRRELARQLAELPRRRIAEAALRAWGLILVTRDLDEAAAAANELAPEHLEIHARRPEALARKLTCAGAIFLGPYAVESLGDYVAGPSHTLPTGGTARAFSGVSVHTFLRRTSLVMADAEGLTRLAGATEALAAAEGLEAHRRAVEARARFPSMSAFRASLAARGVRSTDSTVEKMRKEERY